MSSIDHNWTQWFQSDAYPNTYYRYCRNGINLKEPKCCGTTDLNLAVEIDIDAHHEPTPVPVGTCQGCNALTYSTLGFCGNCEGRL